MLPLVRPVTSLAVIADAARNALVSASGALTIPSADRIARPRPVRWIEVSE